jgi:hypothetical protein
MLHEHDRRFVLAGVRRGQGKHNVVSCQTAYPFMGCQSESTAGEPARHISQGHCFRCTATTFWLPKKYHRPILAAAHLQNKAAKKRQPIS